MANVATEFEQAVARRALAGAPGGTTARRLAQGPGWCVDDVVCDHGPQDRPFEERHSRVSLAIVAAGSFQYRAGKAPELMTPGSLLLGQVGQSFECRHEHAAGDRCIAFHYDPEFFQQLAADVGVARPTFFGFRLPPLKDLSALTSKACAGVLGSEICWEELSVQLAACALRLSPGPSYKVSPAQPSSVARVTRVVRALEHGEQTETALADLARQARLSPYHFLRVFQELIGVTPHQYILRGRLLKAAVRLVTEPTRILDIALDSGFGDVSNFNRSFRAEFGRSPRAYRQQTAL